jgi:Cu/Ag efflux protein CusF
MRRLLAALVLIAAASALPQRPAAARVRDRRPDSGRRARAGEVTLKHQDIKGFMPGMTMAFKAETAALEGRKPGDLVTGTLVVGEVDVHISKLAVTGYRELDPTTVLPADGSAIIQPGTR